MADINVTVNATAQTTSVIAQNNRVTEVGTVAPDLSNYVTRSETGNFAANTGVLTGVFYPLNSNPSDYVKSSETGIFQTVPVTGLSGYVPRFADNGTGLVNTLISATNGGRLNTVGISVAAGGDIYRIAGPDVDIIGYAGGAINFGSTANLTWGSSSAGSTRDLLLSRDSADTHAWRNGTKSQTGRLYNSYTSSSVGSWLEFQNTPTNTLITTRATGTGILAPLQLGVGNSGIITITTGNKVGINTSSPNPSYLLDVNGIMLASEIHSATIGNSAGSLAIKSAGLVTSTFHSNGGLGINNTTPREKLDVSGNILASGLSVVGNITGNRLVLNTDLAFNTNGGAIAAVAYLNPSNLLSIKGAGSEYVSFGGNGGLSSAMVIRRDLSLAWSPNGDGSVRLNPDVFLFRDAANTLALRSGINAGQTYRIYSSYSGASANASTGSWLELQATTGSHLITTVSSGTGLIPLQLGVNRSGAVTVSTGNFVGIRNDNPQTALDISGVTTFRGNALWGTDNTFNVGGVVNRAASVYTTNIDGGGGNGVTITNQITPTIRLTANGDSQLALLNLQNTSSALSSTGIRQYGLNLTPLISQTQSGSYSALRIAVSETSIGSGSGSNLIEATVNGSEKFVVTRDSRVGINNNNPLYTLDVSGNGIFASGLNVGGALTTSTGATFAGPITSPQLTLTTAGNIKNQFNNLTLNGTYGLDINTVGATITSSLNNNGDVFRINNSLGAWSGNLLNALSAGVKKFSVSSDGSGYFANNVGIKNLTPTYPLDVSGSANISGQLYASGISLTNNFSLANSSATVSITQYGQIVGTHVNVAVPWSLVSIDGSFPAGLNLSSNANTYWSNSASYNTNIDVNIGRLSSGWLRIATGKTNNSLGSLELSGLNTSGIYVNGKVGINNLTPLYTLDVSGSGNFSSGIYASGLRTSRYIIEANSITCDTVAYLGAYGAGVLTLTPGTATVAQVNANTISPTAGTNNLNIISSGISRILVSRTGQVGVNTTNPLFTLDVNGSGNFTSGLRVGYPDSSSGNPQYPLDIAGNTRVSGRLYLDDAAVYLYKNGNGLGVSGSTQVATLRLQGSDRGVTLGGQAHLGDSALNVQGNITMNANTTIAPLIGFNNSNATVQYGTITFDSKDNFALRNGAGLNPQTLNIYNSYTDTGNFERLALRWTGNACYISTEFTGVNTGRSLTIQAATNLNLVSQSGVTGIVCSGTTTSLLNTVSMGAFSMGVNCGDTVFCDIPIASGSGIASGTRNSYAFAAGGNSALRVETFTDNFSGSFGTAVSILQGLNLQPSGVSSTTLTLDTKPYYVNTSTGSNTWLLPNLTTCTGRTYFLKNRAGAIILSGMAGQQIFTTQAVNSLTINSGEAYIAINGGQFWDIL